MSEEWINRGKAVIMKNYGQYPIVPIKGDGVYVWDANNKKYIDFVAGISVNCLGYNNKDLVDTISNQLATIHHMSNLYWIPPQIELAELLCNNSCFDRAFFCNSGAEANEAAIKLAKKYSYEKYGPERNGILSMKKSFHGRTMETVSLTGQEKYQKGFNPLTADVSFAEFNNIEDVKSKINDTTCAIILEPIQAEGGIFPATKEFLQGVRDLCDEKDLCLIYDEVQCGMGRTGKLWAYELTGVEPDIITLAKGLAGGIPIGAMLAKEEKADAFKPGNHASTFGGNYIACAGGKVVVNKLLNEGLLDNVKEVGAHLTKKLKELKEKYPLIVDVRGEGFLQGLEFSIEVKDLVNESIARGLLLVGAGAKVIRFVPAFIITKEEIDEGLEIFESVLNGK